jgi:hypothetical protein
LPSLRLAHRTAAFWRVSVDSFFSESVSPALGHVTDVGFHWAASWAWLSKNQRNDVLDRVVNPATRRLWVRGADPSLLPSINCSLRAGMTLQSIISGAVRPIRSRQAKASDRGALAYEKFLETLGAGELEVDGEAGTIIRIKQNGGRQPLRGCPVSRGEGLRVCIKTSRGPIYSMVARLIYTAVRGPIPPGMKVAHINRDAMDNRIANLVVVPNSPGVLS